MLSKGLKKLMEKQQFSDAEIEQMLKTGIFDPSYEVLFPEANRRANEFLLKAKITNPSFPRNPN